MKTLKSTLFALCLLTVTGAGARNADVSAPNTGAPAPDTDVKDEAPVRSQPLTDWQFAPEGVRQAMPVRLPHTWNAADTQNGRTYRRGKGTYTRTIAVPESWKGRKRVFVRFEAAGQAATVYVNGKIAGSHLGAFTAFCVELTDDLDYGKDNILKVEADNRWRADLAPISGGFAVMGGLYRPAELIVTDLLCISPLFHGSRGVFVDTRNSGEVTVRTHLHLGKYSDGKMTTTVPHAEATVETSIYDAGGRLVASSRQTTDCRSGSDEVAKAVLHVDSPHLWQGKDDPYMYRARVRVSSPLGSDEQTVAFGFREVSLDAERGFMLNGRPYPVHGVSRHQDMREKGWALTHDDNLCDMRMMDDMGVTAIRMAHYPQSEDIHAIADSLGMLVWDEVPLVNDLRNTADFECNALRMMTEMMMQLYNHPSVCWWGLFNEVDYPETPFPNTLFNRLNDMAHAEGGNRLTSSASNKGRRYYNGIADMPAWNNYPGWYWMLRWPKEENNKGRVDGFAEWMRYRHGELGGRRFAISEYGAGGNPEHHMEGPLPQQFEKTLNGPFHPEEWQSYVHEETWRTIKNNQNLLCGSFVWAMFDFIVPGWSEGGMVNLNTKGLITHDRKTRKDAFYFYKANWNNEPMTYICSRRMKERHLQQTDFKVYSNCETVTLYINGKKIATAMPDDIRICTFRNCHLKEGENIITAIGVKGKRKTKDTYTTVFRP